MDYYIFWRGKQTGPLSGERIKHLISMGELSDLCKISRDRKNWITLRDSELFKKDKNKKQRFKKNSADFRNKTKTFNKSVASNEWYLYRDKTNYGPYSGEELEMMHSGKQLLWSDFLWQKGNSQWQKANEIFPDIQNDSFSEKKSQDPEQNIGFLSLFMPLKKSLSAGLFKKDFVRLLIFFAVCPMIFYGASSLFKESVNVIFYFWGLYFSLLWAGAFSIVLKPTKGVLKKGILYGVFTATLGIIFLLSVQQFPFFSDIYSALAVPADKQYSITVFLAFVFGVGICEELCKVLPILLFALKRKFSRTEYIFLCMMSGLGFALAEGVMYAHRYGTLMLEGNVRYSEVLSIQFVRLITLPILHASWSGIMGWFIATVLSSPVNKIYIFITGLLMVATLHGTYNFLCGTVFSIISAIIPLLILSCYLAYGGEQDVNILDIQIKMSKQNKK